MVIIDGPNEGSNELINGVGDQYPKGILEAVRTGAGDVRDLFDETNYQKICKFDVKGYSIIFGECSEGRGSYDIYIDGKLYGNTYSERGINMMPLIIGDKLYFQVNSTKFGNHFEMISLNNNSGEIEKLKGVTGILDVNNKPLLIKTTDNHFQKIIFDGVDYGEYHYITDIRGNVAIPGNPGLSFTIDESGRFGFIGRLQNGKKVFVYENYTKDENMEKTKVHISKEFKQIMLRTDKDGNSYLIGDNTENDTTKRIRTKLRPLKPEQNEGNQTGELDGLKNDKYDRSLLDEMDIEEIKNLITYNLDKLSPEELKEAVDVKKGLLDEMDIEEIKNLIRHNLDKLSPEVLKEFIDLIENLGNKKSGL